MAYGLKVKNEDLEIQIDNLYRNYCFKEGATGIAIANAGLYNDFWTTVAFGATTTLIPLVLFRPSTDDYVAIMNYNEQSAGVYNGFHAITEYKQATTIDWRLYLISVVKSGETYGLRIYDANTDLAFDSGLSYFKISSIHTIDLATPTLDNEPFETITHSQISDPYYILAPAGCYWYYMEQIESEVWEDKFFRMGLKKVSSTQVNVGWFCYYNTEGPYEDSYDEGLNPTMQLLVCDVT